MIEYLEPMRQRREELMRDRGTLMDILVAGSERARERARETMQQVREAMKLTYGRDLP